MSSYATYDKLPSSSLSDNAPDNVISITNFEQKKSLIQSHDICVIDMYGEWCNPCKQIAPKYAEIASKYNRRGICAIVKEDVDLELPVIGNIDINGVPTFLFYINGNFRPDLTVTGANVTEVENKIRKILRL